MSNQVVRASGFMLQHQRGVVRKKRPDGGVSSASTPGTKFFFTSWEQVLDHLVNNQLGPEEGWSVEACHVTVEEVFAGEVQP